MLPLFESSDGNAVQFRLQTDSTNRRVVGLNNSGAQQSQILLGDSQVQIAGPTVTGTDLFATFDATGLVTSGAGMCNPSPCDGVFLPSFTLEPIEEHAVFMWENSHLQGVGPTSEGAPLNVNRKIGGLINELEKAHIYIEQLNEKLNEKGSQVDEMTERLARLEAALLK